MDKPRHLNPFNFVDLCVIEDIHVVFDYVVGRLFFLALKVKLMDKRYFSNREIIFSEGDISGVAYIIQDGSVSLSKKTNNGFVKEIATLGVGKIIGEVSLITNQRHSVTATAHSDGHALVLQKDDFMKRLKGSDRVLSLILESVIERLRTTY